MPCAQGFGAGAEAGRVLKGKRRLNETVVYQANKGFVTREIAGELLVVPVGEQTRKLNGMITFSESGAFLWKLLQERRTKEELVAALANAYEQEPKNVEADVDEFLRKALSRELIVKY